MSVFCHKCGEYKLPSNEHEQMHEIESLRAKLDIAVKALENISLYGVHKSELCEWIGAGALDIAKQALIQVGTQVQHTCLTCGEKLEDSTSSCKCDRTYHETRNPARLEQKDEKK